MTANIALILFGFVVGFVVRWVTMPPCPRYRPKYWVRDE